MINHIRFHKHSYTTLFEIIHTSMTIARPILLNRLIQAKSHHLIKIITGIRRCGKSYLLFRLFKDHLLSSGINPRNIIEINLEHPDFHAFRNALALRDLIDKRMKAIRGECFILIDEIQLARKILPPDIDLTRYAPEDRKDCYLTFYDILNGLLNDRRANIYVTGSNARLLSSEVSTYFRGRGEIIDVSPLSFAEFHSTLPDGIEFAEARDLYFRYGGLPECVLRPTEREKRDYLQDIVNAIYLRDISERNNIKSSSLLEALTNFAMSNIGALTNPAKLANALTSAGQPTNHVTVGKYLSFLEDAFLIRRAVRYDIKGKRYLAASSKFYAMDTGLRNAVLGFRQIENSHLMENVVYNELKRRGYAVDVGIVNTYPLKNGVQTPTQTEIDFVANNGSQRLYIQSAYAIPSEDKLAQETNSLRHLHDGFRRIVINADLYGSPHMDDNGITFIGLKFFLLTPKSIETL